MPDAEEAKGARRAFRVPRVVDNPAGWGPCELPEKFTDQPYAPFNKGDKLGKVADWSGPSTFPGRQQMRQARQGPQFANENFAYQHDPSDESFHLVDTATAKPANSWGGGRGRGRGGRGGGRWGARGGGRWGEQDKVPEKIGGNNRNLQKARQQGLRGKWNKTRQAAQQGMRWSDRPPTRIRESSIDVRPGWQVLEQVNFSDLQKVTWVVPEAQDVTAYGVVEAFERTYDRITPKSEKALQAAELKPVWAATASDDPVLHKLANAPGATYNVFATDAIMAAIMAAPRSSYSWDIVVTRAGERLYLDKRGDSPFDYLTCNETAHEQGEEDKDSINSAFNLSQEATRINFAFAQQVLTPDGAVKFEHAAHPLSVVGEAPTLSSAGYRYRSWQMGDNVKLLARTQVEAVTKGKQDEDIFLSVHALNETDPKVFSTLDWRQKLEAQRGAVLATELKNNSYKLAKWTLQSLLAGADLLKLGYISRVHPRNRERHVILGTQTYKPKEFATQVNLNVPNAWAILKAVIDMCLKLPDGKYLLLKDPNKPLFRLYDVSEGGIDDDDDDDDDELGEQNEEDDD
ncbi:hypothetical protein KFE25_010492 [Diacronema lutheri]|uniref:Eukaryotic translation initiation factor 3 subunit D n=2 Tax=Diacronema lutheri TaxID=2081491 RepID=A0A8J5XLT0_DIALT|nr:hypothetical protein KFE25_010492 [Diacronema lutheri]